MTSDVEQIKPLELLHRIAERGCAVVCLSTTRDARLPGGGKRIRSTETGAQLRTLAVVRPSTNHEISRWQRLQRGQVLAVAELCDAVPLDDAAALLVYQLDDQVRAA